jgi:hypothetical protein
MNRRFNRKGYFELAASRSKRAPNLQDEPANYGGCVPKNEREKTASPSIKPRGK